MSDSGTYLKSVQFGVVGVIFTTVLICGLYSGKMDKISALNFRDKFKYLKKSTNWKNSELKMSKNVDKCELNWKNSKVNLTAYKTLYDIEEIQRTVPKPVKSLYPDPVIRLNPDKFLLAVPTNGPNNQLTGLREATFVAIKLNRTLVLPRFFKHFSDSSVTSHKLWYLYPGHRIDIEKFCKFVSCVTIEQFQQACGHQLDAVVFLQKSTPADIKHWESYTGMTLEPKVEGQLPGNNPEVNINLIPDLPIPGGQKFRKFPAKEVKSLLDSDERCVIYPRPLYNVHLQRPRDYKTARLELVKDQRDIGRMTDYQVFLSISEASGSPRYIKNMAKDFVSAKIKNRSFISVHWRYNKDDFMKRCRSINDNPLKRKLCENAMRIKPEHMAQAIEKKITDLRAKGINIRDVYIASPPSERTVVAGVAKLLYDNHGWFTYSSLDLDEFMETSYKSCEILESHFEDIVSTTEMEICGLGTAFLGSARSSWTGSVNIARRASSDHSKIRTQSDGDIFSMSVTAMRVMSPENEKMMEEIEEENEDEESDGDGENEK